MELPGRQYLEQDTDFLAPHHLFPPRKGGAGTGDVTGRCGRIGGQKENGADGRVGAANKETAVQNKMKTVSQDGGCPDMRAWAAAPGKEMGMPVVRMLQISPGLRQSLDGAPSRLCDKSTVGTWEAPVPAAGGDFQNTAQPSTSPRRHIIIYVSVSQMVMN